MGHGWISDALQSTDDQSVFGTLWCNGIHDDSLEVIFSMREVRTSTPLRARIDTQCHHLGHPCTTSSRKLVGWREEGEARQPGALHQRPSPMAR